MGKYVLKTFLTRSTCISNLHFAELFSLPFQIRYHVAKAYIFSNNDVNNLKVELKVSGRVRVGVGRDLLSQ